MSDPSAFDLLGQQLQTFLTAQFTAPQGTSTELAFLPSGVSVRPDTFLDAGVVNPLLVADWLNTVADTAPVIVNGQVSVTMSTASDLMQSVALFAEPTAPVGSDAANVIGRLKNLDSTATAPGVKEIDTAPTDWYDAAKTAQWPLFTASSTTPTAQPTRPGIWRWRTLDGDGPITSTHGHGPVHPAAVPIPGESYVADPAASNIFRAPIADEVGAVAAATVVTSPKPLLAQASERAAVFAAVNPAAAVASPEVITTFTPRLGLDTATLQAIIAAESSTTPVTASSLTLNVNYLMVLLSRAPWWSADLINAPGWCFAGQRAGALVPGNLPTGTQVGVPVALILTCNVAIHGTWSDADRTAASSSTHLGPWQLPQNINFTGDSVSETLLIPDMQLMAGIYTILSTLPPADDPALGVPREHILN
jgi:hypothetical protein